MKEAQKQAPVVGVRTPTNNRILPVLSPKQRRLVEKYQDVVPTALSVVSRRARMPPSRKEELLAEGYLALCLAVTEFDHRRGAPLVPYLRIKLKHFFRDLLRSSDSLGIFVPGASILRGDIVEQIESQPADADEEIGKRLKDKYSVADIRRARKVHAFVSAVSMDAPMPDGATFGSQMEGHEAADSLSIFRLLLRSASEGVNDRDWQMFMDYMNGYLLREIGCMYGISESLASKRCIVVREHLAKRLGDLGLAYEDLRS